MPIRACKSKKINPAYLQDALCLLNVDLEEVAVFGYLPNPATTTIAAAGVYQLVSGPFANPVLRGFSVGMDYIQYTGTHDKLVKIICFTTLESNVNNNIITIAVYHNGVLITGSETIREMKFAGDINSWGLTCDTVIKNGDTIQLVVKSNKVGSVVTFNNFQTNLFAELITHE